MRRFLQIQCFRLLTLLILVLLLPRTSFCQNIVEVGRLGGSCDTVVRYGNYAVTGNGNMLTMLDMTNPAVPRNVGQLFLPDEIKDIAIASQWACVANNNNGLQIINLAQPANPVVVGSLDTSGTAVAVAVANGRAYVVDYDKGVQIIDIRNPSKPVWLGNYSRTSAVFTGITVVNGLAYLTGHSGTWHSDWRGFLRILDLGNPGAPVEKGYYEQLNFNARKVTVANGVACVTGDRLKVFDVRDPANIRLMATSTVGTSYDVVIQGSRIFVSGFYPFFTIFNLDTSHPSWSLALVGQYDWPDPEHLGIYGFGLQLAGQQAWIAGELHGFQVIDFSKPFAPSKLYGSDRVISLSAVAVAGTNAWAVGSDPGMLHRIDISDPAKPILRNSIPTSSTIMDIALSGNLACIASGRAGLRLVDVSNPIAPRLRGNCLTTGTAMRVTVKGNFAYLVTFMDGLQIADISNPDKPRLVGCYRSVAKNIGDVAVSGNRAYLAVSYNRLEILDVSNPARPALIGSNMEVYGDCIDLSGRYACVGGGGLSLLDVGNPDFPACTGVVSSPRTLVDIKANAGMAFGLLDDFDTLLTLVAYNIANPSVPLETGRYKLDFWANQNKLACVGNLIMVTGLSKGLRILRYTAPIPPAPTPTPLPTVLPAPTPLPGANITVHGSVGGEFSDFCVRGNLVYRCEGCTLSIVNSSAAGQPVVGLVSLPERAVALHLQDRYAYVIGASMGLYVIDVFNPALPRIISCLPSNLARSRGNYPYYTLHQALAFKDGLLCHAYYHALEWASGYSYIRIIDVRNPAAPVLKNVCNVDCEIRHMALASGVLYYRERHNVIHRLDMGNLAQPHRLPPLLIPGDYNPADDAGLDENKGYLYVANGENGLLIYNINGGGMPVLAGSFALPRPSPTANYSIIRVCVEAGQARIVSRLGNNAYLNILNLANPVAPVLIRTHSLGFLDYFANEWLSLNGSGLWIRDNKGNFRVYGINTVGVPSLLQSIAKPQVALQLAAANGKAFAMDQSKMIRAIGLNSWNQPVQYGQISLGSDVNVIRGAGGLLYALTGSKLKILSMGDISHPVQVGSIAVGGSGLTLSAGQACVASGGVALLDVQRPATPIHRGSWDVSASLFNPETDIYDVEGVGLPGSRAGMFVNEYEQYYVEVAGDHGTESDIIPVTHFLESHLETIDLSNPTSPRSRGKFGFQEVMTNCVAIGNYICALSRIGHTLKIFDMNNPDSPTLVNTMKLPMDDPVDLAADNGLLFVVGSQGPDGLTGLLQVIDISDPVHPVVLGYQNLPYQPQCLAVENGRIFVSFYPLWEHSTMDLHRGVMAMTYTGPKPPAPPQVTDLSRSEYAVGRLWPDSPVYADRTFKFTNAIPPELLGELYIRTCNDDKNLTTNPLLSFTVNRPVRVYVALNSGIATPPAWLKGWLRRAGQLMTTDVVPGRVLYYRDFAPGRITLGPNRDPAMALHKSMYTVVITPIVQNQSSVRGWKSYL